MKKVSKRGVGNSQKVIARFGSGGEGDEAGM